MPLSAGDKLSHYEVSLLGQGWIGEVYQARDTRPGRTVAMKIFRKKFNDRFEREVGAVTTLNLSRYLLAFSCFLMLCSSGVMGQTAPNPERWQAKYTQIYSNDFETGTGPTINVGLQLQGSSVSADPSLVIRGRSSLLITDRGGFVSIPALLPLAGNTVYTIQFDYRIVAPATSTAEVFYAWFQPAGTTDSRLSITIPALLKNAAVTGTFSTGALTATASSYILQFYTAPGVSLVLDNFLVYRQDITSQTSAPPAWSRLSSTPFPRLGKYMLGNTAWMASGGVAEGKPFTYTVQQIESSLAFHDVIAGLAISNQTWDPDSIYRIRALNPNAVILPYRIFDSQNTPSPRPDGLVDLEYQFFKSIPKEWKATDTAGNVIYEANFPELFYMNLSDLVPVVNGQTWRTALPSFVSTQVFPSGLWDGILFDHLQGTLDGNFPNLNDPSRFNYDWNRNGLKDETPASTNEMLLAGTMKALQQLNSSAGGLQLTMGNGAPQFALAPMVNGYTFECFNFAWNQAGAPISSSSPGAWRVELDSYLRMVAASRPPQINVLEACGANGSDFNSETVSHAYLTPTPDDLQKHRFSMGTALLGDGFYSYDLLSNTSAPYWFDEYSVDSTGNAVEDRAKKGYLGDPLTEATELTTPVTPILQDGFESSALGNSWIGNPASAVTISRGVGDVISGSGSLVISNPDHTKAGSAGVQTNPKTITLTAGSTYLLTFDWRILETIDDPFGFLVTLSGNGQNADHATVPGVVAGDFGTVHFPFTVPSAGNWTVNILITAGGGKVAIDNVTVSLGGVGPWRRDFENGFALVNPLSEPHTFSAADLAGNLNRTGIHRVKGTQAPNVNDGQPVTGDLTLGAFDAIILLADRLNVPGCSYSLNYSGQAFAAQGGTGTIMVTTGAGCPWSIGSLPAGVKLISAGSGIGNGIVTFQVLPNLGGGISGSFTIADQTFSIEQSAASIAGLAAAGSLGQVASEGTWDFSLVGINLGASAATARFTFADNNGHPLALPLTFPQSPPAAGPELASTIDRTLSPNEQIVMESTGPDSAATLVGSGQLLSNGNVSGFGIFSNPKAHWAAVAPLETRNASRYILAFDNTGTLTTGVAVANLAAQAANVTVLIRDDSGAPIGNPAIPLSAMGHTSFMLNDPQSGFPVTKNRRGTIEFDTPPGGQISVLGLRANGPALTTLPVLANVGTAGGSITHVAYNGGWTSVFYLVNTGNASASFTLSFADENGLALPAPLLLPQSGTTITTSALMGTLAAGAMLVVNTQAQDAQTLVVGSAQLTATGNISGFEIFRWNTFNQEASVPLESRTPNSFVLVFDDTNGLTTGVALANLSDSAANITVTMRDDIGAPLPSMSINLPPRGHKSFMLPDPAWYPAAANKRGMAEFSVPQGLQISVIGLRAKSDGTLTTIPVLTK